MAPQHASPSPPPPPPPFHGLPFSTQQQQQQVLLSRLSFATPLPFDTVLARLYASVGTTSLAPLETPTAWPSIASAIKSYSAASRASFVASITAALGAHGLMIFQEFNIGAWVPLFGVGGGMRAKRVILGNPLVAVGLYERAGLEACMGMPVEVVLVERLWGRGTAQAAAAAAAAADGVAGGAGGGGAGETVPYRGGEAAEGGAGWEGAQRGDLVRGTEVIYMLPSGMICGANGDQELLMKARVVDDMLRKFVEYLVEVHDGPIVKTENEDDNC